MQRMIVAVHSYKGGTGKTLISANLATLLAAKGRKTCLLDMDFRAPSLHALFNYDQSEYWLNDYMNGACRLDKVLRNVYCEEALKEKLFVGFANPSTEAIREMSAKDRKWEMQALTRLLSLRTYLFDGLGFDHLILDTSPGLQYSSINAVIAADIALVVTTSDKSDMEGTLLMLHDLYEHFNKKKALILNKIPSGLPTSEGRKKLEIMGCSPTMVFSSCIACSCDIPLSENPCFWACEKQGYPFSGTMQKIASLIDAHQF
jgi:septum site-determining protein MinD